MITEQQRLTGARGNSWTIVQIVCLWALLGLLCWSPPPNVNETYYLTKAKHFWDPGWCPNDLFLNSANAHWVFYCVAGWPSLICSLETFAWIGRITSWLFVSVSLIWLAKAVFDRSWLALATAPLVVIINRYGHLAGEWFVGGFEGKCFAYGFAFLAISARLSGRRWLMWPTLGLAMAFHVLVGGWITLAVMAAEMVAVFRPSPFGQRFSRAEFPWIAIGGALALAGIWPAALQNLGTDPATIVEASQVQVLWRLSHHLLLTSFHPERYVAFACLVCVWTYQAVSLRRHRQVSYLNYIALGTLLIAVCGAALSLVPESDSELTQWKHRLLTLYWFRAADVMVPLATGFGLIHLFVYEPRGVALRAVGQLAIPAAIAGAMLAHLVQFTSDARPPAVQQSRPLTGPKAAGAYYLYQEWVTTCRWIDANTPANAVFLTPAEQQTFKWYAGRAEVASWKDMPQDARSICQWRDRIRRIYQQPAQAEFGLLVHLNSELIALADDFGATHLVVDRQNLTARDEINYPVGFRQIYPGKSNDTTQYVVFQLVE